jgi:hypothetical protein
MVVFEKNVVYHKTMDETMFNCILELAKVDHAEKKRMELSKRKRKRVRDPNRRVRFNTEVKIHRYDRTASVEAMARDIKMLALEEAEFWHRARFVTPRTRAREKRLRDKEFWDAVNKNVTPRTRARKKRRNGD